VGLNFFQRAFWSTILVFLWMAISYRDSNIYSGMIEMAGTSIPSKIAS
jgi:hypothetical protein